MSDLIDRQKAIDALISKIWQQIEDLPSAEPEVLAYGSGELVQESDSLVKDCISIQAEIDAMEKRIKDRNPEHFDYHYCSVRRNYNGKELPSKFCHYCGACMEVDDERPD